MLTIYEVPKYSTTLKNELHIFLMNPWNTHGNVSFSTSCLLTVYTEFISWFVAASVKKKFNIYKLICFIHFYSRRYIRDLSTLHHCFVVR